MSAVEDLLASLDWAPPRKYTLDEYCVRADIRELLSDAIAADAREASQNLECRTCGVRGRKAARAKGETNLSQRNVERAIVARRAASDRHDLAIEALRQANYDYLDAKADEDKARRAAGGKAK